MKINNILNQFKNNCIEIDDSKMSKIFIIFKIKILQIIYYERQDIILF